MARVSPRKRRRLTEAELEAVRKRAHRFLTSPHTPRKEARDLWLLGDGEPGLARSRLGARARRLAGGAHAHRPVLARAGRLSRGDGRVRPRPRRRTAGRSHGRAAAPAGRRGRRAGRIDVAGLERRLAQGDAQALVLCDEDDIANFHLALAARELQPELRLVVRLFNLELGAQAERLLSLPRALGLAAGGARLRRGRAARRLRAAHPRRRSRAASGLPGGSRPACSRSTRPTACCPTARTEATQRDRAAARWRTATRARRRRRGQVASVARAAARRPPPAPAGRSSARAPRRRRPRSTPRSRTSRGGCPAPQRRAMLGSDELEPDAPAWLRALRHRSPAARRRRARARDRPADRRASSPRGSRTRSGACRADCAATPSCAASARSATASAAS